LGLRTSATISAEHPFDLSNFRGYLAERVPETDESRFQN
jgi:hypothetical protein